LEQLQASFFKLEEVKLNRIHGIDSILVKDNLEIVDTGKQRLSAAPQQRLAAAPHIFSNVFFMFYVMQRRKYYIVM
jgi:hypothetical protein